MPTKKPIVKKAAVKKTLLQKVSKTASHIKEDIISGKDHLVEFAGDAFHSIKGGVKHLVETGKKTAKKKAVKKITAKKIARKITPRKIVKKAAKKLARKK